MEQPASPPRLTPVRRAPDKSPYVHGLAQVLVFGLLFFAPVVLMGDPRWFWLLLGLPAVVTVLLAIERRYPHNRAYLVFSGLVPLWGLFMMLAAALHLQAAFHLRETGIIDAPWQWPEPGIWLFFVGSGTVLAVFFNICLLLRVNADAVAERMARTQGAVEAKGGVIYFNLPNMLRREETGLSPGMYRALCWMRGYAIGLCLVGGILGFTSSLPGMFRPVGGFERLLEVMCTMSMGLGMLALRPWAFRVMLAFQRRWERMPAQEAFPPASSRPAERPPQRRPSGRRSRSSARS